jgi:predicted Fe-Mo cluster-binding NifX family protein
MEKKLLIPLLGNEVAPRFDLATEAMIVSFDTDRKRSDERLVVLPKASAEELCQLILSERIQVVICGGIEDEYYQYLKWKHVEVLDSVIGSTEAVLDRYLKESLRSGDILRDSV